jgi:uncharacterized protein YndB with AHSA1/START domain
MIPKEKLSLNITRRIKAERERVYAAWTDVNQLREWFGPEKVTTRELVADVKVGGKYRWDMTSPEGEELTCRGEYRELQPGRKIVFTWSWDDDEEPWKSHDSLVTVELSDCEGGTEIRLIHVDLPTEQSRRGHNEGWNSCLDKLERRLSNQREVGAL